jgi:hypothetical protein
MKGTMKRITLIITATVILLAASAPAQSVLQTWGLTYTNVPGTVATTNTVSQATNDFFSGNLGMGEYTLLASVYWRTNNNATIDPQTSYFKLVPSADGTTWLDDEFATNNYRLPITCSLSNTVYTWAKFDPRPFRYWKVAAFERPSTNFVPYSITLQLYRAK